MSNDRGDKNSEFSTFSSFSRNTFPVPVKYLDSACNRYSQQLACDLQTTKDIVVEAKCRENPYMFIVDQPQTILRICPRQNVHLSRADADTGRSNEVSVDYSFDANDSTDGRKRSRAPRVTDLRSPKDNEKPNGIEPEPGDAGGMADDSVSLPLSSTRFAKNTFTTTASETSRNGAAATDPASDIFNYSLSDFIASVTIPPPPPPSPLPPPLTPPLPLPLPPPPQQATELFPDAVTKRGNSSSKQNSLEGLSLAAGRHRNNPTITDSLLAGQSLRDGITFTSAADHRSDDRRRSNAPVDLRRELSQSLSVPCSSSDDDFSKFVIPPPPIDALIHDSMSKLRESRNSEEMLFSPPIANCVIQLPPPVSPPRTPAPLSISRLPPLHPPSKSRLAAGRSPSLSPRATSANSAVSRPPSSSSSQSPSVFETFAFGLDSVPSPEPDQRTVEGKTKQSESTDLNRSSVQRSNIMADSTVASRENSKNTVDDSEASPSTHSGGRSNAKVTPPAPPPRRLNSSVNSSPVVKRSERRVSFGLCPPSTRYFPLDGDVDNYYHHHQGQGNERAEIGSSFAKRMDFSTDSMEDLRRRPVSTTAQIRPNALRTSGSLEFHGVLLEDAAFATDDFSRMARTGCSSSYKASASVFAAIRSRLKTYWSPSMPRRRTSLRENDQSNRPSSAGWSSTTSFDFEQESSGGGDDPKGRGNSRLAGDPNKNRFSLIIDSTLDAEHDNDIELYPEKSQSTPNTFNSFTGQ